MAPAPKKATKALPAKGKPAAAKKPRLSQAEAQEFRRKSRAVEVEWVQDMDKRGFDGKNLLSTARSLIEKHSKTTKV